MFLSPEFWVGVAGALFIGALVHYGIHRRVLGVLDDRVERIRNELKQAQNLREEAQIMVASARQKQREAEAEAREIVEQAREDAKSLTTDCKRTIADTVERYRAMTALKIALAEEKAIKDIRAGITGLALSAARDIMTSQITLADRNRLIDEGIDGLKKHLN
ncbi:MAG: F0F1 ATP synthase subunit B [Hyphomicrobiales bacterium]